MICPDMDNIVCGLELNTNWYARIGIDDKIFHFLIDSGSPVTFIDYGIFEALGFSKLELQPAKQSFTVANGNNLDVVGKMSLTLCIDDVCKRLVVHVAKLGVEVGILGVDALSDFDVILYARKGCISVV